MLLRLGLGLGPGRLGLRLRAPALVGGLLALGRRSGRLGRRLGELARARRRLGRLGDLRSGRDWTGGRRWRLRLGGRRSERPRLLGLGHVGAHRPRRTAERSGLLGLVGRDVHEERLAALGEDGIAEPAREEKGQAGENVEQQRHEYRDYQISIGPVLWQELHTPCPCTPHCLEYPHPADYKPLRLRRCFPRRRGAESPRSSA